MADTLTLASYSCDPNVVDKTGFITEHTEIKTIIPNDQPVDLMYPVLRISYDNGSVAINESNYFLFKGRCYFLKSVKLILGKQIEIVGEIDVLHTYHDSILNSTQTITRSADLAFDEVRYSKVPDSMRPIGPLTIRNEWLTVGTPITTAGSNKQFILQTIGGSTIIPKPTTKDEVIK